MLWIARSNAWIARLNAADLVAFLSRNCIYAGAMGEEAMRALTRNQVQQAA